MEAAWLVPAALGFGMVVGVGGSAAVVTAHARGRRAASVAYPTVPEGVEAVIDSLDAPGMVLDSSNNVLSFSPAAVSLGLVSNRSLADDELTEIVDRVRATGVAETTELQVRRGPFTEVSSHLLVRAAPLGTRFMLVLAEDRTEAQRLEEVRRDFVANISHELKTPIGAIGLLSEALESAADSPEDVRRFARRLGIETDRLRQMTHEIIELSRLQASDVLEDARLVSMKRIVAQAVDAHRVVAESRGIEIAVRAKGDATVWGDEGLLATAVSNLVVNAIQHSPDGARVGVGVTRRDGSVEIAVTDQGVGIPEAERERVFERFYRVDAARSRATGGTGLGLAIVKHVVQNHGGDVRVWSQPGHGSTFTIRLPEADAALAESTPGDPE